jgi:hypothetical protein
MPKFMPNNMPNGCHMACMMALKNNMPTSMPYGINDGKPCGMPAIGIKEGMPNCVPCGKQCFTGGIYQKFKNFTIFKSDIKICKKKLATSNFLDCKIQLF